MARGPAAAEIVVDNFAGGGGASTGIAQAIGRAVDVAINHADTPEEAAAQALLWVLERRQSS